MPVESNGPDILTIDVEDLWLESCLSGSVGVQGWQLMLGSHDGGNYRCGMVGYPGGRRCVSVTIRTVAVYVDFMYSMDFIDRRFTRYRFQIST
jgi:hypothetical protein